MEKQARLAKSVFAIKQHNGNCIVSYPRGFDKSLIIIKLLETDMYREVLIVANNESSIRYYKTLIDSHSTISSVNVQLDTAQRIIRNESLYMIDLVIFTDINEDSIQLIGNNSFMEAKIVLIGNDIKYSIDNFTIVDHIDTASAKENNWLSNNIEYNLGLEFSSKNKQAYKGLSETIRTVTEIFKDSRKLITVNNSPVFKTDYEVLFACVRGFAFGNRYFKAEEVINKLAEKKGWTQAMIGADDSYASILDKFWNPVVIKNNAVSYSKAIYSRNMMMSNNAYKRDAILQLLNPNNNYVELPAIIFNESIEFAEDIALNLEQIVPSKVCCYHSQIKSRLILDFLTGEYIKTKNGIPKKFGKESLKKMANSGLKTGFYNILSTGKTLDFDIQVPALKTVITTSGNINPIIESNKSIQHESLIDNLTIINIYFKDFILDNELVNSRDLSKLIQRQTKHNIEPIWINSMKDIKC